MACNCNENGNIYNISMGCCVPVVANADNYYTKDEVDEKLEEVVISGGGVTHNEMENYVSGYTYDKATINEMIVSGGTFDPTQYYTTLETDERIVSATSAVNNELTAHTSNNNIHVTAQDKNNWNNKSNFSGSYNDLTDKPTIPTVPTSNTAFTNDAGYITSDAISGKADTTAVTADIAAAVSGKVETSTFNTYTAETATEIGNKLAVNDFNSYSGAVDTTINSKASESDLSAHTANTDIHVTTAQTAAWNAKSDFSGSYNDLSDKPTIPTVPTDVSAFNNDAGYITSDSLSGKQDTLVSGVNIKTINNESLLGSGNITISGGSTITIDPSLDSGSTNAVANSAITNAINSKASQSDLSALTDVVSAHTANTNIHVTTAQTAAWDAKSNFSGSYNDLTDKPTIPTDVSAFNNDAGYITSSALSGYAESSAVTQEISAAVSGKVDVSVFNSYSAATNTAISNKADSSSLNNYLLKSKIWCGTQAEYDLIQNKDAETLYLIHS